MDVGALSPFSSNYGYIWTTLPLYTEMGHSSSRFGLPDPAVIWTHDLPFRSEGERAQDIEIFWYYALVKCRWV